MAIAKVPSGADGNPAIGLTWPSPARFVVGTNTEADCITDTLTGLMWSKNASPQNSRPDWAGALSYTDTLSLCGHTDWRLPNINELQSLVNDGYTGADASATTQVNWLQSQGFTSVQVYYWSSSTYAGDTTGAWFVGMPDGSISFIDNSTTSILAVWPVRGGE